MPDVVENDQGKFDAVKGFSADAIEAALDGGGRVYFSGHLARVQERLGHFDEFSVESGMTTYAEYKAEKPHVHLANEDVNYVISGAVKLVMLDTGAEQEITAGGIFFIPTGVPHAVKAIAGTRVFFVKSPGGNDKQVIDEAELPECFVKWAADYDVSWDGSRLNTC